APLRRSSDPGGEVRQCRVHVMELFHVGDDSAALEGESEVIRCRGFPPQIALRALQRIERTVYLDGVQATGQVFQFMTPAQVLRVEDPSPVGIDPARRADADLAAGVRDDSVSSRSPWPGGSRMNALSPAVVNRKSTR